MRKKLNSNEKSTNRLRYTEQKSINNSIPYSEFSSILKKFYDSFSKYIQSMRNCLKEINLNIANNKSITLDESSNKCISSLNIIFSYLDSSFNQFYSNIQKFSEQINSIEFSKISYSSKKPNLSQNFSLQFYNDSNKHNTLYSNYQQNKIESGKTLYNNINKNRMNVTTDLKYNNSIEERYSHHRSSTDLSESMNNNLIGLKVVDKNFVENVKNLLNILKYERISDINKKSQYQQKFGKFKENLIIELSNEINDKQDKDNIPVHRRIKSVNLNRNSFNYFNNINKENDNKIKEYIIQEKDEKNLSDLNEDINYKNNYKEKNKTTENRIFLYYLENNNINGNINDINNIDNKIQIETQKLKNDIENLERNKKELLIQIANLITKNNALTEEISLMKNSKMKKEETENSSITKIKELNNKIELIMNSKNDIEKKNKELQKNINVYQSEKESQLKELKKLKDNIDDLKKENRKIKELKLEIDDLNREISGLIKENQKLANDFEEINSRKEEYKEKYKQTMKELTDEKEMNNIMEKKVKNLERKLEEYNINEFDDTKTKTYKISNINKVNEIEVEKLNRKYVSPYNYRKNTSAFSTNNTSNNRKILINNNIDDFEITPENYVIVKFFQLNNKLKWYLLKKNKKQISEQEPSPTPSPNQSNSKQLFRRYKYLKINSKLNNEKNEDNYDDYIWKPSKNERDFINFNYLNEDNIDSNINNNNKKDNSMSKDWQKKINELESCIKDLEEKLEKKENDCNRINLNFAKLFKRSKQPELNYDKLLENNENLKNENLTLKRRIDDLKSTQNFIGLSFIEDDLEGSRFIDDKCFEDILDELIGNNSKKASTYKRNRDREENKYDGNMLKFFRSHNDDNDNKDINEDNRNNDNNKADININNNNIEPNVEKKEKKIHLFFKNQTNDDKFVKKDIKSENKNNLKELNKQRTFKYENNNINKNMNENNNEKNEKIKQIKINIKNDKKDCLSDNSKNDKNNDNQKADIKTNENKKYLSYRFSRFKQRTNNNSNINNKNDNKYDTDLNNKIENKDENIEKNKEKIEIKTILMKKNYFKNESKKDNIIIKGSDNGGNNDEQKNQEKKIFTNKLTEINNNKNIEKEPENKNIYTNTRRIRKSYKRYQDINNETDNKNNNTNNYNNEDKNNDIAKKEEKKENKPYRSLKSMKIESEIKIDKGLQESSSQTNRVCRARRFYKRKQDEIKNEIKE